MDLPKIIKGYSYTDARGIICYNNSFDTSEIKRIYTIENINTKIFRGWQGHKIEKRWFMCLQGEFEIHLIKVDNWKKPSKSLNKIIYNLSSDKMDILHVPPGFISCIRSKLLDSKLLSMSDYRLNEINDDYRFESNYFKLNN